MGSTALIRCPDCCCSDHIVGACKRHAAGHRTDRDRTTRGRTDLITARVTEVVVPEPTVETLVPGFPATDDLEVFLLQVERDPDLLGQSGAELADELRKVIEQRGNEQRTTAQNLREVLVTWVADDEIPSAIADALDDLLAPLAKKG